MARTLTEPVDTAQNVIAYHIVSPVSDELAGVITGLQATLAKRFPGSIWNVPRESLHISFTALSPFFGSDRIVDAPPDVPSNYTSTFRDLISDIKPIELHFENVEAFPGAIILRAHDDGTYKDLRDKFNQCVTLPADTKPTPNIIHTTICKFHKSIDLAEVKDFLSTRAVRVDMTVSEFRIIREKILYMVSYDTLERFSLTSITQTKREQN